MNKMETDFYNSILKIEFKRIKKRKTTILEKDIELGDSNELFEVACTDGYAIALGEKGTIIELKYRKLSELTEDDKYYISVYRYGEVNSSSPVHYGDIMLYSGVIKK